MGTALDTGQKSAAPPAVKLQNVGDVVRFMVVDITNDLPMTEYGTDQPKLNRSGKQMTQHALTVLVTDPGQGVVSVSKGERYEPAETNELHTIYISSWAKWDPDGDAETTPHLSWGGALDAIGGLEVGMIGEYRFVREVKGDGAQPRKDRRFRLRHAKPEEQQMVDRCEELHAQQQRAKSTGTSLPASGPFDDEDQF